MSSRLDTLPIEFILHPDNETAETRALPAWLQHFARQSHPTADIGHAAHKPKPPTYPAEIIGRSGYPLYPDDAA